MVFRDILVPRHGGFVISHITSAIVLSASTMDSWADWGLGFSGLSLLTALVQLGDVVNSVYTVLYGYGIDPCLTAYGGTPQMRITCSVNLSSMPPIVYFSASTKVYTGLCIFWHTDREPAWWMSR